MKKIDLDFMPDLFVFYEFDNRIFQKDMLNYKITENLY